MLLRSAFFVLLSCGVAVANPWPRDHDGTFVAITEDFDDSDATSSTEIFVESTGADDALSIGLSSDLENASDDWSAFAFVRQPLSAVDARDQFSLSAGVGAQYRETGSTEPLVIIGGAWDRDMAGAFSGWLTLEGQATYLTNSGETEFQGGATVAVEPIDRIALVNELSLTGVPGSGSAAEAELTSSIVGSISSNARVQLGATVDLSGNSATGFRLGTWLEF